MAGWGRDMAATRRGVLVAPLLVLLAARPAQAHAVLEASTPAANAEVAAGPVAFRLHYNSRVDAGRSRLRLVGPGKSEAVLAVGKGDGPNVLTAAATLSPGAYTLRWQVLAVDGHITQGVLRFTVRAR